MDEIKILTDEQAMLLALQAGTKGLGRVHPNPPVGCVILSPEGKLLSTGYHRVYGGDHAEVDALKALPAGAALKGARVFVTLEPCAHEGKTPSCAKALAKLPLQEVIYGLQDPNPLVAGKGAAILQAAGIQATLWSGDNPAVARDLHHLPEIFLHNMKYQRPFFALKLATTLDGAIAGPTADERWITGTASLQHVHYLRAQYDAVLVGVETFIADNPSLNIRHPDYSDKLNITVVLDPHGRGLRLLNGGEANLLKCRPAEKIVWVTGLKITSDLMPRGVVHLPLDLKGDEFDLAELSEHLFKLNIRSVFIEGGAQTAAGFVRQKQVQRLYHFIAPKQMGPEGKFLPKSLMNAEGTAPHFEVHEMIAVKFGQDQFVSGRFE